MTQVIFILLGIVIILMLYGLLEANTLRAKTYVVKHTSPAMKGQKIAVFSDVHLGGWTGLSQLRRCKDRINREKPDYILFAGDFADKFRTDYCAYTEPAAKLLRQMKATYGKYAVYGNNDRHMEAAHKFSKNVLLGGGFNILKNNCVRLADGVVLLGISDCKYDTPDIEKALADCPPHSYKIALVHQPDYVSEVSKHHVRMQVSGHSHGGQVRLPILTHFMLPTGAKKYIHGQYKVNHTKLFISNGVGVHTLPFRFCAPPDILVFKFE